MAKAKKHTAEDTLTAMKMSGVTLPRHPRRQSEVAARVSDSLSRLDSTRLHKVGSMKKDATVGNDISLVIPKYFDPRMTNRTGYPGMLMDMDKKDQRDIVQQWCRLFYSTHPVVGACVDIYSRFPVAGLELTCKDSALTDFYTELFLEDLCNPPEAPIWMGDYSFKPLGEVVVGDEVIGWETNENNRRKLVRSKVLQVKRRNADNLVKVVMESGREIVCTDDHVWANYCHSKKRCDERDEKANAEWLPTPREQAYEKRRMRAADLFEQGKSALEVTDELGLAGNIAYKWKAIWESGGRDALRARKPLSSRPRRHVDFHVHDEWTVAFPGASLVHVVDPTPSLEEEQQVKNAAWLGGIYDGEGCGKAIAQYESVNPEVRERIKNSLGSLGITYGEDAKAIHVAARKGDRSHHESKQEFVDFLNWVDPVRRTSSAIDKILLTTNHSQRDVVRSVEHIGSGEVISLTTESGNYVAWGYASKNCYEDFLVDLGKEYWTVGECFPFAAWDEDLGIWTAEELLNPEDIEVKRLELTGDSAYLLTPPEFMVELVRGRNPYDMYKEFEAAYPELIPFIERGEQIPVSDQVLSHLARRENRRSVRGTPIMLRGFKTLMLEDRMEAAMQAVADRLYSPLVLFKLGVEDLGDGTPWIPTPTQIDGFKETLDAALTAEFRALVTHFGISVDEVFTTNNMANRYKADREMFDERMFMVFGLAADMLKGSGNAAQPYASSALRVEFVNQMLATYQKVLVGHYESRAKLVAEAQGHYDYEKKGTARIPIMEDYLVYDEATGEKKIESRPKLLFPEMRCQTLNFRDEATQRDYLLALRNMGLPVSDQTMMVGIPWDWDEETQQVHDETIKNTLSQMESAVAIYNACIERGLPVPPEVLQTVMGSAMSADNSFSEESAADEESVDEEGNSADANSATGGGGRPNVSDEKKEDMPKAARKRSKAPNKVSRYTLAKNDEGEEIYRDEIAIPQKKVRVSMVDENYVAGDGDG